MANYYTVDSVTNFVLNKRNEGVYTDCKVSGLRELKFYETEQLEGYTVAFTLTLKDKNKRYKGKRLKVLTVLNWFSYQEIDFDNDSLTQYFDTLLGV